VFMSPAAGSLGASPLGTAGSVASGWRGGNSWGRNSEARSVCKGREGSRRNVDGMRGVARNRFPRGMQFSPHSSTVPLAEPRCLVKRRRMGKWRCGECPCLELNPDPLAIQREPVAALISRN
jgi:hypothetical protein